MQERREDLGRLEREGGVLEWKRKTPSHDPYWSGAAQQVPPKVLLVRRFSGMSDTVKISSFK